MIQRFTFDLLLLRIEEDRRPDVVIQLELLHGFEPDQNQPGIVKLLDGVHLVPLHHDLLLTVNLQSEQAGNVMLKTREP